VPAAHYFDGQSRNIFRDLGIIGDRQCRLEPAAPLRAALDGTARPPISVQDPPPRTKGATAPKLRSSLQPFSRFLVAWARAAPQTMNSSFETA
jgi:hypothetical protein